MLKKGQPNAQQNKKKLHRNNLGHRHPQLDHLRGGWIDPQKGG